jgi:plasmid stabilization system protein ParE
MRVHILDDAKADLLDGFKFYEEQSPGLGEYFLDSLFADIDSLQIYGGIHEHTCGYQRLLAKRFPFAVYYRVEKGVVRVRAVLDCRRDPAWIRKRLS